VGPEVSGSLNSKRTANALYRSAHTINGVHPNAEKRTNVEVLIGHPMLKAEAAEKLSCWPKIYLGG
jgi:hypothetical protein